MFEDRWNARKHQGSKPRRRMDAVRRRQQKLVRAVIESLETRQMLAVSATFISGQLRVEAGAGETNAIEVGSTGSPGAVYVREGGVGVQIKDSGGNAVFVIAPDVTSIYIDSGDKKDTIDAVDVDNHFIGLGAASVTILGGSGGDDIIGTEFADSIDGGTGNDVVDGDKGNDTITGGDGTDELKGGSGNDNISGGNDDDTLRGQSGDDALIGGSGNDRYAFKPAGSNNDIGNDTLTETSTGGTLDVIDFSDLGQGVTFSLLVTTAQNVGRTSTIGSVALQTNDFEGILAADDVFDDSLTGSGGNDLIVGRAGNDTIIGGAGDDSLQGDEGNDSIDGGTGNDLIVGRAGNDVLHGQADNDTISGTDGDDSVTGDDGNDVLHGGVFVGPEVRGNLPLVGLDSKSENGASGAVVGRLNPNVLWIIDDSFGNNTLFANDATNDVTSGELVAQFTLNGAQAINYEDIAYYTDPQSGTGYIYIADIGDNTDENTGRGTNTVTIYRVAEPDPADYPAPGTVGSLDAEKVDLTFAGSANAPPDCETLMVDPLTGDLYIVTKSQPNSASAHLYYVQAPTAANWQNGQTLDLSDAGAVHFPANTSNYSPAAGDIAPSGLEVLLKSDDVIFYYKRESTAVSLTTLLTGSPTDVITVRDTQNRVGIAFTPDGQNFYTVSEADSGGAAGEAIHYYTRASGNDTLSGGANDDLINGGDGTDSLTGDTGNDTLNGGAANDSSDGGGGSDTYVFSGSAALGTDTVTEAANLDTDVLDFSGLSSALTLNISLTGIRTVAGALLSLNLTNSAGIENVIASTGTYADSITGNGRSNRIEGNAGADTIRGDQGNDTLLGGAGLDSIFGEMGNDELHGGDDRDILVGDSSTLGAMGNDTLYGDAGNDDLFGDMNASASSYGNSYGSGMDELHGGTEGDLLQGDTTFTDTANRNADDSLYGDGGSDTLWGDTGPGFDPNSASYGHGYGNDLLDGGTENDTLRGQHGNDTYHFPDAASQETDTIYEYQYGGLSDLFDFSDVTTAIVIDLSNPTIQQDVTTYRMLILPSSSVLNFEQVKGGSANDTITGNTSANTLLGNAGADTIYGRDGADSMSGGAGNDLLWGQVGNDTLHGDTDYDTLYGGVGNDSVYGDDGFDELHGGDQLEQADGNDRLSGGTGWDTADYQYDTHNLNLSIDGVANDGETGELDNILTDVEQVRGGSGNDTMTGNADGNTFWGGAGNDSISGGLGNDWLAGGPGADTLHGDGDNDACYGGTGDDFVYGDDGNDGLHGGDQLEQADGNDVLSGGNGTDRADYQFDTHDLNLSIDGVANDGEAGETDNILTDVEDIWGGLGNDQITGSAGVNVLLGRDGNDVIYGRGGDDSIRGGYGNDQLLGEDGNDSIFGDDGDDVLTGGIGNDSMDGGNGADRFWAGDTTVYSDILNGGQGDGVNDTVESSDSTDVWQNLP
jgi:Ca2+-binding RTX toxin-like protein